MKKIILLTIAIISLCSFTTFPFQENENGVILRLKNADLSPITIDVHDVQGRLVFSEVLKGQKEVGKIFNFGKAFPNTYTIRVVDGNTTYTHVVSVK